MPTQGPPPEIRRLLFGGAGAGAHSAPHGGGGSIPKINTGLLQRGAQGGGLPGGGGGGKGGGSAGAGSNLGENGFNDPVVTGMGYEQNPQQHGILGLLNNGKQSATGNQQEALHGRFAQMSKLYNSVLDQGGSEQAAMTAVHRADPNFLMDILVTHPAAIRAFQSAADLHKFISGQMPTETAGGVDPKSGKQFFYDANGVASARPVPGMGNSMGTPIGKPITTADGKLVQPMMGQDGKPFVQPFSNGAPDQTGPGGTPGGGAQFGAPGGAPAPAGQGDGGVQMPMKPAKPMTQGDRTEVNNLQQVMQATDAAKNANQAQGSFGMGGALREGARIIPGLGGMIPSDLGKARETLGATISGALGGGSSRLKAQYGQMQQLVPGSFDSTDSAMRSYNNIQNMGRTAIAQLASEYPQDATVQNMAKQYNATPSYWLGGQDAQGKTVPGMQAKLQQLTTNPGALSSNDVASIYAFEAYDMGPRGATPKLSDNQLAALGGQMNSRNLWGVRDSIIQQNPAMGGLPDAKTFNDVHGEAVKSIEGQLGARAKPSAIPSVPNPQATQRQPAGQSYLPENQQVQQLERAEAQNQQIQEQDSDEDEDEGGGGANGYYDKGGNTVGGHAPSGAIPGFQQPQSAAAGAAPGGGALPNANYKPTSQADAMNYNELQDLRRGGLASGQATAPVQWAGNSGGGSASVSGHPGNQAENQAAARADELHRAMMQKPTPPGQQDYGGGQDAAKATAGGPSAGMAWTQDPIGAAKSALGGMFGQSEPPPGGQTGKFQWSQTGNMNPPNGTAIADQNMNGNDPDNQPKSAPPAQNEAIIQSGSGRQNPDASYDQNAGGGEGGTPAPQMALPDVNVNAQAPSPEQVIPIPPPQPANATNPMSAFNSMGPF